MSEIKTDTPFLRIAMVLKTKGLEGELLVQPEPGVSFLPEAGMTFYLAPPLLEHKELHLCAQQESGDAYLLSFAEIADRGAACEAVGRALLVRTGHPDAQQFFTQAGQQQADFPQQGYEVFSDEGAPLGTLIDCLETGANLVWVVADAAADSAGADTDADAGKSAHELLLPVIDDLQITVDDESRRVTVRLLPGLLELNR